MPKKYMSTTEGRFAEFRDRLKAATGDKAVLFRGVNSVHVLANEFSPLSDLRASADYRRQILGQLLRRAWLESTGHRTVRLEDLA